MADDCGKILGSFNQLADDLRKFILNNPPNPGTKIHKPGVQAIIDEKEKKMKVLRDWLTKHTDDVLVPKYGKSCKAADEADGPISQAMSVLYDANAAKERADAKAVSDWQMLKQVARATGREVPLKPTRVVNVKRGQIKS